MSKLRANQITNKASTGAPTAPNGLVVTGVTTSTTFSGSGSGLTGLIDSQIPNLNASKITAGTLPTARGGTGLTSLGTAGQALKVNSSGNGLEYGSAAGMQLLYQHSTTGGTAVNSFSVDGYFDDSKYTHYKVFVYDHFTSASSGSNQPSLRFNVGGSAVTGNVYYWSLDHAYGGGHHNRGNGNSGTGGASSIAQMQGTWEIDHYNFQTQNFEITFFSPTSAKVNDGTGSGAKYITWMTSLLAGGTGSATYMVTGAGGACMKTDSALTGFTMYSSNSTTFTYKVSLYGILK